MDSNSHAFNVSKSFYTNKKRVGFKIMAALFLLSIVLNACLVYKVYSFNNSANRLNNKPEEQPAAESKNTGTDSGKTPVKGKKTDRKVIIQRPESLKGGKVAYLTFDDGPTRTITPEILDILGKFNIKATFFVLGSLSANNPDILKRIQAEGHLISNHTYSHQYEKIYSSPSVFMKDVVKCEKTLKSILGSEYTSKLIRFPGGSFGSRLKPFRDTLRKEGYNYIDWNALNGDAEGKSASVKSLKKRVEETLRGKKSAVILMHDSAGKETTVQALPNIIKYIKSKGYKFKTLENYKGD